MNWFDFKGEWIKTDDLQWRKQLNQTTFELVEVREYGDKYGVFSAIVDVNDYDIEEEIKPYYSSLEEFNGYYKEEERNGIIAECIFEQINEIELGGLAFDTEDEAEKGAEELIQRLN